MGHMDNRAHGAIVIRGYGKWGTGGNGYKGMGYKGYGHMDNRAYGHGYRGMCTLGLCIIKDIHWLHGLFDI